MLMKWIELIELIIIEALNKDAREQKGGVGDIESFAFSCLDQDKNFVVGISGMSS